MQLDKLKPQAKYSLTLTLVKVEVNGKIYRGLGDTEMEARSRAAETALQASWLSTNAKDIQPQASHPIQHSTPPGKIFT